MPLKRFLESIASSMTPSKKKAKVEEEEEEESESESEDESTDDEDRGRGKRKKVSSAEAAFEPTDFTLSKSNSQVKVIKGRGKKLKDFPSVRASMEKYSTDDVLTAHKFLFGNKGMQLKKKELVNNLLEFSGYLKAVPKGYSAKKLDAEDEVEEVRQKHASYYCRCIVSSESHC